MRHNYVVHNRVSKRLKAQHKAKRSKVRTYDLKAPGGRPIEIKTASKDHRFRIGKKAHSAMVKAGGTYVFVKGKKRRKMSAKAVSKRLTGKKWYRDRTYPHRFVPVSAVF